jgi:hypothetical protein
MPSTTYRHYAVPHPASGAIPFRDKWVTVTTDCASSGCGWRTASSMVGSCVDSLIKSGPVAWGLGEVLTTSRR